MGVGRDWILLLKVLGCDGEVGCLVGVRFATRVICLRKGAKREWFKLWLEYPANSYIVE